MVMSVTSRPAAEVGKRSAGKKQPAGGMGDRLRSMQSKFLSKRPMPGGGKVPAPPR